MIDDLRGLEKLAARIRSVVGGASQAIGQIGRALDDHCVRDGLTTEKSLAWTLAGVKKSLDDLLEGKP